MKDMTVATSNNHLSLNCCREEKKQTGRVRYVSISGCHTRGVGGGAAVELRETALFSEKGESLAFP